jgi:hypothetical protein
MAVRIECLRFLSISSLVCLVNIYWEMQMKLRTNRIALVAVIGVLASCSGSDEQETDIVDSGDSSSDATSDATVDSDGGEGDEVGPEPDARPDVMDDTAPDADAVTDADVPLDCDFRSFCEDGSDCGDDQICSAGLCQSPIAPEDYLPSVDLQWVSALRLGEPGNLPGLDLDFDGEPDNLIGELLASLPNGAALVEREMGKVINDGWLTLAVEVIPLPGTCGKEVGTSGGSILIHLGNRDLNYDGVPDESEGLTQMQIRYSSFVGEAGPVCQLHGTSWDESTGEFLAVGGENCQVMFPLFDGTMVNLPVSGLQVLTILPGDAKDGETQTATVAGYVEVESIVNEANRLAPACPCAGIDTSLPVAEINRADGAVTASCVQDVSAAATDCDEISDGNACPNLPALCTSLLLLSAQADIESDPESGSGLDSVSFGFEADLMPAATATPAVGLPLQAIGDTWRTNAQLTLGPGYRQTSLQVMANDEFDAASDALQSFANVQPAGTPLTLAVEGNSLLVQFDDAFPETGTAEVTFEYTIGNGTDRASSATVTMRVSSVTLPPDPSFDEFVVPRGTEAVSLDVLQNDFVAPDAAIGIDDVGVPSLGSASIAPDSRSILYVPDTLGTTEFNYSAFAWTELGGQSESVTTSVYVQVVCPDDTFGPDCVPCRDCGDGTCNDGELGDGLCVCPDEFAFLGGGREACVDVDECDIGFADCAGDRARCINTVGSYECVCNEGFEGDGFFCRPVGTCGFDEVVCDVNATCVDPTGSGEFCQCNRGFSGSGLECTPGT